MLAKNPTAVHLVRTARDARARRELQHTVNIAPERPNGVNLIGHLGGEFGLGASARLVDEALMAAKVPTSTFAIPTSGLGLRRNEAEYRHSGEIEYNTSVLAVAQIRTVEIMRKLAEVVEGSYRIGMWYWEIEYFIPGFLPALRQLDEIWAPTDFINKAIAAQSPIPVRTLMPPLPQRAGRIPPPPPADLGIERGRPYFLFVFDYLSFELRKNAVGLIEAFKLAFQPDEGPLLVIKTMGGKKRPYDVERVKAAAGDRPDIVLIDKYLSETELDGLMANCAAYVSLHRAEGLGLTIAEAMAWGRPVIVSEYSGNMQFNNANNAFLVPCGRAKIPSKRTSPYYPAGQIWGDPDLAKAAEYMRFVLDNPAQAGLVGARAAIDIATKYTPEVSGAKMRAALSEIWQR
jgi:glycosyltransferase involved in cell wall biosynthesis